MVEGRLAGAHAVLHGAERLPDPALTCHNGIGADRIGGVDRSGPASGVSPNLPLSSSSKMPAPASARSMRCRASALVPVLAAISAGVRGPASRRSATPSLATTPIAWASQAPASMPASACAGAARRGVHCDGFAPYSCATLVQRSRSPPGRRRPPGRSAARDIADGRHALLRPRQAVLARTSVAIRLCRAWAFPWARTGSGRRSATTPGNPLPSPSAPAAQAAHIVAGHGDQLQLAGLGRSDQGREREQGQVDSALGEIGNRGQGIAIRHVEEVEPGAFRNAVKAR